MIDRVTPTMVNGGARSGCYLDAAATSPLLPEAREAMLAVMDLSMTGRLGNASSLHSAGRRAMTILEEARVEVARLINAEPDEIIFTSGGSESNNTVTHIFVGQQIITSLMEHPSLLASAQEYAAIYKTLAVDEINPDALMRILKQGDDYLNETQILARRTPRGESEFGDERSSQESLRGALQNTEAAQKSTLVSVMLANNETGVIFPVKKMTEVAHSAGALFHTDATQALGKIPVDVKDLGVDYLTASAHKIGGPVGIGILYVRRGAPYKPLILGGHQEKGRRAGTSQVMNAAGFGAAAKWAREQKTWRCYERQIRPLRDILEQRILAEVPYASINAGIAPTEVNDARVAKGELVTLPNILNVSFRAAEGESIQLYLDLQGGVQVSTGSACASGDGKPSHVLMAISGGDAERAHSSIRFSLGLDTSETDIERVMQVLPDIIKRLQGISTVKMAPDK